MGEMEKDGVSKSYGIGALGELSSPCTVRALAEQVKKAFGLPFVLVYSEGLMESEVKTAALCPGSGGSVIETAFEKEAQVLITGDIGHHEGIDAVAQGLAVIDAGHYGIEHIFMEDMRQYLGSHLTDVEVMAAPIMHPFTIM